MNIIRAIRANGDLIQPKDRNYKRKGKKRDELLEAKDDNVVHALRVGMRSFVVIEIEGDTG